ncbi:MAG: hypothetical protein QM493_01550 [Sulfurovum sp.]
MKLENSEPTLESIEDYDGNETPEKRKTVWLIIIVGVVIAVAYGVWVSQTSVSDTVADQNKTGIFKY